MAEAPERGATTAVAPVSAGANGSLTADSLTHSAWTVLSRISGLGRVVAIGAVLGPTYLGNTFLATNLVPNLTYELLTGSLFASLLVPPLVRAVDRGDRAEVERIAGGFLGVALVAFGAVIVLVVLAGPLLLGIFSMGVTDGAVAGAQRRVGWTLLALLMPQVALYGIAGTAGAVLHAHGRFALPAAAPILENVGVMLALAVYAVRYGVGTTSVEEVTLGPLLVLGIGSTIAVALHAGAVWLSVERLGVRLRPRAGWRDADVRVVLRRAVPSLGYAGANAARQFGVLVVANRVPGGVVAFQLALNFYHLPVAVGARPVAVAFLPRLARHHDAGDGTRFATTFARGLSLVCLLTVPAAVGLLAFAGPLAGAVSFGEMRGSAGVALLAAALASLAIGVVGEAIFVLATNGAYAQRDARSPFVAMAVRTIVSGVGMAVALSLDGPTTVMVGLGVAVTVGNLVGAISLTRSVVDLPWAQVRRSVGRTALASLGMLVVASGVWFAVQPWAGWASGLPALALVALTGLLAFVALLGAMRSPDLTFLREDLRSGRPRREQPERTP